MLLSKEIKVNWAASPGGVAKQDTSQHHHIFVGDLSPEIDTESLRNAFTPFGEISDCRVVRDPSTNKSKGYGFCSFVRKIDAQTAIEQMNGQWLGSRSIRTNWATRKPPSVTGGGGGGGMGRPLDYDEVFQQSSSSNCTVYVGGVTTGDENALRRAFSPFGRILEVRYFKDKGYAFVRYDNKESACNAIVALHSTDVGGQNIKCSWGKEGVGPGPVNAQDDGMYSNYENHQARQHHKDEFDEYGPPGGGGGGGGGPGGPHGGGGGGPHGGGDPQQQAYYQQYMQYQQQQYMQQAQYNPQYVQQMQQYYAQYGQYPQGYQGPGNGDGYHQGGPQPAK